MRVLITSSSLLLIRVAAAVGLAVLAGIHAGAAESRVAADLTQTKTHTHHFTLLVGEVERRYTVHVPSPHGSARPLPVVVVLHGGGGTNRSAAAETGWAAKAEREGFLAVFPDALARYPARRSSFVLNPQLWNDGSERFYEGQQPPDDIAFLDRMLDDLGSRFPVDEQSVFFTGFSNGASMTFLAAARLAPRIAAIAPVAGACWITVPPLTPPVPACYITGTADPLNLIEGGAPKLRSGGFDPVRAKPKPPVRDSVLKWAQANDCPVEPRTITETNGVRMESYGPGREGSEVVYVAIDDLGHTWAGGNSLLPESMVGPHSGKISATDLIWIFFQKHVRPAATTKPQE